jgi:hypothetical protein
MGTKDPISWFVETAQQEWPASLAARYLDLGNKSRIACVAWGGEFYISGTDILKIVQFRLRRAGTRGADPRKIERSIISALRGLRPGRSSILLESRDPFMARLDALGCIKTRKRQKVFLWDAVDHQRLFQDALAREQRRGHAPLIPTGPQYYSYPMPHTLSIPNCSVTIPSEYPSVEYLSMDLETPFRCASEIFWA